MVAVLTILHVIICVLLCVVVLMQSSKGDGLSGAFGGGGGLPQQMFGSRGMTTALHKATVYLATGFFLTSALLFIVGGRGGGQKAPPKVNPAEAVPQAPVGNPLTPLPGTTAPGGTGQQAQDRGGNQQQDQAGGGQP